MSFNLQKKSLILLLLLILVAFLFDLLFFSNTLEDAQITYRYSLRFAEGYDFGMWNRTGSPVEGFTTFLWMIYLSLFGPNLDHIVYASKVTTILSHISIIILFFALYLKFKNNNHNINVFKGNEEIASKAFLFTSIAIAVFLPLSWYATTGMETLLFVSLITFILFLPMLTSNIIILSFLTLLLVLTRPDGIMFALASPLYYLWITKNKKYIFLIVLALITFISLAVFRYSYFGYFMPNTYYAKSVNAIGFMHLKAGVLYFGSFFITYIYIFIPIIIMLKKTITDKQIKEKSFFIFSLLGITIYFIILAKAGADNFSAFPMWRHALNLFPLIIFCSFWSIFSIFNRNGKIFSILVVILLFFMPLFFSFPISQANFLKKEVHSGIKKFPDISNEYKNNKFLLWLNKITDDKTVIATSLAGMLPLTVDAYHIDILGLNDEYIAHNGMFDPNGPTDSKTDMDYVMSLKPDLIEGYMNAKIILKGKETQKALLARKKMNIDLISNPIFQKEYLIITNAPYQSFNRILFINKDYYHKIKYKFDIEVMPVDNLVFALKLI